MTRYASILDTIGRTPVVRLNRIPSHGAELYVKLEAFNPMGSVKDRMARAIIDTAERSGELQPGQTVVEATSGNTGIALAMVCAARGYPLVVVMAENFSVERRRLMRFLGARVVLTPAALKGSGMLAKARELAERHGWFLCRQFDNPANALVHEETTAREILADFPAGQLDYWVSGFGTGGTLAGVARVLKRERPGVQIVACEPDNAPLLGSGVPQPLDAQGQPDGSHPAFRPHLMQGWSPDFVSSLTRQAMAEGLVDRIVPVDGRDALAMARALAREEGILAGTSAGATLAGAVEVCRQAGPGARVLCMLPDTGERYLSTPLFEDVAADMNEEEMEISRSTPLARFDAPPPVVTPIRAAAPLAEDPAARAEVETLVTDPQAPVVMFALAWCEFCWSVRKLFDRLGIAYRSVDLDAPEFQVDDRGGRIRRVLETMTGASTIPQVFIGGELVGGCTDVFEAYRDGRLARLLAASGVQWQPVDGLEPEALLPQWLHAR